MRAAPTLLALLAGAAGFAAPAAAGALDLEVVAAWNGWSRPGRTTELELRLSGEGAVAVTVDADGHRVRTRVTLAAGDPVRVRLPVTAAGAVTVEATPQTGAPVRQRVPLSLAEAPLLAWVAADPGTPPPSGFRRLLLDPAVLPATATAFGSVDALVIDANAFAALDDQQWRALLDHIAACGRTVLVGASAEAAGLFASAAGCGSRALAFADNLDAAATTLDELLQGTVTEPPAPASLAALGDADLASWHLVVGTLAAGAALLLLGAVFAPTLAVHVGLAAVVAIGAMWVVQSRPTDAQLVVWAEAGPGERLARYRALQQVRLVRRDAVTVDMLEEFAAPVACRPMPDAIWEWSVEERRYASVTVPGRLFDRLRVCYAGHFPVARAAQWRDDGDGGIAVRNSGPSGWPEGIVAWQGELLPLPAVAAGAEFVARPAAERSSVSPAERLAAARTARDAVTILWPLSIAAVQHAPARSQAWLLVAAEMTGPGDAR